MAAAMRSLVRAVISATLAFSLAACTKHIDVKDGKYVRNTGGEVQVQVLMAPSDLEKITQNEIHLTLTVMECETGSNRYPGEVEIEGVPLENFDRELADRPVRLSTEVPAGVFERYRSPCVLPEGGNMLGTKVRSDEVPLIEEL